MQDPALKREWQLARMNGQVIEPADIRIDINFLSLEASASLTTPVVSGFSGCNRYSGLYTLLGGGLQIDRLLSTLSLCIEDIMAAEYAYSNNLRRVTAYQITQFENPDYAKLYLYDEAGQELLEFTSLPLPEFQVFLPLVLK